MQSTTQTYLGEACKLARNIKLCINEVLYCEGEANYTHIHLTTGKYKTLARTLLIVEKRIASESFVRISRKHLVNRKFIAEIGADYVVMSDKTTLPISRRKRGVL